MDEHVIASRFRLNKTIALLGVEPLDGTDSHRCSNKHEPHRPGPAGGSNFARGGLLPEHLRQALGTIPNRRKRPPNDIDWRADPQDFRSLVAASGQRKLPMAPHHPPRARARHHAQACERLEIDTQWVVRNPATHTNNAMSTSPGVFLSAGDDQACRQERHDLAQS